MPYLPRFNGRIGDIVGLNSNFYNAGVAADPFKIEKVEIYKCSMKQHNLVTSIPTSDNSLYPAPIEEVFNTTHTLCDGDVTTRAVGQYILPFFVPNTYTAPDVYIDTWYYWPTDPVEELGTEYTEELALTLLRQCCHRFWVYPSSWFCDDGLQNVNYSFQPLVKSFFKPESKIMETALIPMPLYNCNNTLSETVTPFVVPTYSIGTQNCEIIVDGAEARLGLRQGSFRSQSYTVQFNLDSSAFLKGTYWYSIMLAMPDGTSRSSGKMFFTIK